MINIPLIVMLSILAGAFVLVRSRKLTVRRFVEVFIGLFLFHLVLGLVMANQESTYMKPSYYRFNFSY